MKTKRKLKSMPTLSESELERLPDDALVTPSEAAKVLRIAAGTLSIWRWRCRNNVFADITKGKAKYDVPHVTIGALVRYRMRDLREFQSRPPVGAVGVIYRPRKRSTKST